MSRVQRRWAWFGFLAVAANAPFAAWISADASWLFNIVVACLLAFVLLADETEARRYPRRVPPN